MREATGTRRPLIAAGLLLGSGMGGFLDGIVFHQLLQVHNMLTGRRPKESIASIEINMFWDGVFHAFTWVLTAVAIAMLWRATRRTDVVQSGRTLLGSIITGWGAFNLIEGVIDHHILHLHHVVEALGVSVWDWVFLASGVLLIALGAGLIASDRRRQ